MLYTTVTLIVLVQCLEKTSLSLTLHHSISCYPQALPACHEASRYYNLALGLCTAIPSSTHVGPRTWLSHVSGRF